MSPWFPLSFLLLFTSLKNNLRIYTAKYSSSHPLNHAICPQYSHTKHCVLDYEERWQPYFFLSSNVFKARIYKMVENTISNNHDWMLSGNSCMDFKATYICSLHMPANVYIFPFFSHLTLKTSQSCLNMLLFKFAY